MERLAAEGPFIGRSIFVYFSFALTVVEERRGWAILQEERKRRGLHASELDRI